MRKSLITVENFKTLNCAQSVLSSFAHELNLDELTAQKITLGFGSGMGMAETCGAVTGAYMVLGLKAQTGDKTMQEMKTETKLAVARFNELFVAKHGSLKCKNLLGVNISTPKGAAKAKAEDLFNTVCSRLVASATDILDENF
jgi:C_GCAxxG_C_C family probable redox protein